MNNNEVLILHGSPGSGKTTLADAISEILREAKTPHAVIDLDELSRVFPEQDKKGSFSRRNLKAIWPNFASIPELKLIIPTVIVDKDVLSQLQDAVPAGKFMICELIAPKDVLVERVTAREPNDYWKKRLANFVDIYQKRNEDQKFGDFHVDTHGKSVTTTAQEVIVKAGW